jgi:hypothetical protein
VYQQEHSSPGDRLNHQMSELKSLTAIVDTFVPALTEQQQAKLAENVGSLRGDSKLFAESSASQLIGNVAEEVWTTMNSQLADKVCPYLKAKDMLCNAPF